MCLLSDSVNSNTNESRARDLFFTPESPVYVLYATESTGYIFEESVQRQGILIILTISLPASDQCLKTYTSCSYFRKVFFPTSFIVVIQSISFLWSYSNKILMPLLWVAVFLLFQCLFCIFYSTLYILFSA